MKHLLQTVALAGAVAAGALTSASAATVGVYNDTDLDPYTSAYRADLTCSAACTVLNYAGGLYSFSGAMGELFAGPSNSGDASEASWVNSVLGTAFTAANVASGKSNGSDGTNYSTNSLYVIVKIGRNPDYTILRNDSGGALTWSWKGRSGQGAGLSHYVNLGQTPAPVPLPAAGVLLLAGLAGLGLAKRRKA